MTTISTNATTLDDNLLEALSSSRDRISVLRLEKDIVSFLEDPAHDVLEVPSLNSYQRLLAHKTGDYYQLTHVSDTARQMLLFHKHPWSKVPEQKLCNVIIPKVAGAESELPKASSAGVRQVKIMKRVVSTSSSPLPKKSILGGHNVAETKEKDKLGKEERYRAARARIFQGVEETLSNSSGEKGSKPDSKSNSRSNSRDARGRNSRVREPDTSEYSRRSLEPQFVNSQHNPGGDAIQKRHQQYFQSDPQINSIYQRPALDKKSHPAVWNPRSSIPLSMANLATLEAQTSQQSGTTPPVIQRASVGAEKPVTLPSRSLAPPVNATGNLWGPPGGSSMPATRNASAMGLNLSASPWTPKQPFESRAPMPIQSEAFDVPDENDDDPTNVLRGLALDDK